jgi:hypothetical protein
MKSGMSDELKSVISQMLKPLKGLPLSVVIEGLADYKIIPFNNTDKKDIELLKKLKAIADIAGKAINIDGISRNRPNEVGNDIEAYIKDAVIEIGFEAKTPSTQTGIHRSAGYPDIEFIDQFGRTNYLECNMNKMKKITSDDFKITQDAHHFLISYEMYVAGKKGVNNIYKANCWKIISLENLICDVKYEFNSNNKRMYSAENILAEGNI